MIAENLWRENHDLARKCLEHPFVKGIASGELEPQLFARYLEQDAYFLDAYARAYAMALAKSPDRFGFFAFKELLDDMLDELNLHQEVAERENLNREPAPHPATLAYTDFLLNVAGLGTVGEIVAAMTPCMRLYAWLGQELAPKIVGSSPYRDWVITYSSPEFEGLATRLEELLNRYSGESERIRFNYCRAVDLEFRFFDAAWHMRSGV